MNTKILFVLFPKGTWILLGVVIAFVLSGQTYLPLAYVTFNLFLFFITVKVGILFHEIGHLLFAKLVGGRPRRIVLGRGHKVFQGQIKGVKVVLNSTLNSGFASAFFQELTFIRLKLFVYISGGFITNFIIAGLFFVVFDFSMAFSEGIQVVALVIFANIFLGILALIPQYFNYHGVRYYSDGMSILRLPFLEESQLIELTFVNELLEGIDLFEAKKYDEAVVFYEKLNAKKQQYSIINIHLSIAYLKQGNYQKSLEVMEELLSHMDNKGVKPYEGAIYNGLAWLYLLLNKLEEADEYSRRAFQIDWRSPEIKGTRGSVLIELGKFEEGKKLLLPNVDFAYPNNQTLGSSIYLIWACHELGEKSQAEKYLRFVHENDKLLDIDEKTLFDKIMQKCDPTHSISDSIVNEIL